MHDRRQLREHVRVRLGWVGVGRDRDFDRGEAEGPDVGGDGVGCEGVLGFAFYAFGLLVCGWAGGEGGGLCG